MIKAKDRVLREGRSKRTSEPVFTIDRRQPQASSPRDRSAWIVFASRSMIYEDFVDTDDFFPSFSSFYSSSSSLTSG
ncbi:hypothetical protein HZH66_009412 [Vespula vulgaris]|uniref:Uncharacterized protein n=1 Tax=Vespula vulgaris TaxID=7454 RepID=A0A834MZJ2_VESVU|nr:hypothetical protein HZH66_009412 [Vespula vulgaris]